MAAIGFTNTTRSDRSTREEILAGRHARRRAAVRIRLRRHRQPHEHGRGRGRVGRESAQRELHGQPAEPIQPARRARRTSIFWASPTQSRGDGEREPRPIGGANTSGDELFVPTTSARRSIRTVTVMSDYGDKRETNSGNVYSAEDARGVQYDADGNLTNDGRWATRGMGRIGWSRCSRAGW